MQFGSSNFNDFFHFAASTRQTPFPGFRTYQLGFLLGGGVKTGRVSLELRTEFNQGVSDQTNARSSTTIFYLLAAFRL
jgi:hypothetical protein